MKSYFLLLLATLFVIVISLSMVGCDGTTPNDLDTGLTNDGMMITGLSKNAGHNFCGSCHPNKLDPTKKGYHDSCARCHTPKVKPVYPSYGGDGFFTDEYRPFGNSGFGIYAYTLWAGKDNDAGIVRITNDPSNLYISVNTNGSADISSMVIYLWPIGTAPDYRPHPADALRRVTDIHADKIDYTVELSGIYFVPGETYEVSVSVALEENNTPEDEESTVNNAGEGAYAGGTIVPEGYPEGRGAWWGYVTYPVTLKPISYHAYARDPATAKCIPTPEGLTTINGPYDLSYPKTNAPEYTTYLYVGDDACGPGSAERIGTLSVKFYSYKYYRWVSVRSKLNASYGYKSLFLHGSNIPGVDELAIDIQPGEGANVLYNVNKIIPTNISNPMFLRASATVMRIDQ
jgi:hypothetical protein